MMKEAKQLLVALIEDESGQDLIEYALVAGMVGLGAAATASGFASTIGNAFRYVGNSLVNSI